VTTNVLKIHFGSNKNLNEYNDVEILDDKQQLLKKRIVRDVEPRTEHQLER